MTKEQLDNLIELELSRLPLGDISFSDDPEGLAEMIRQRLAMDEAEKATIH